nr:MAG TPA: hypothetical protein [Caudoviricetes sp.]
MAVSYKKAKPRRQNARLLFPFRVLVPGLKPIAALMMLQRYLFFLI